MLDAFIHHTEFAQRFNINIICTIFFYSVQAFVNVGPKHATSTISTTTIVRLLWKSFMILGLKCAAF